MDRQNLTLLTDLYQLTMMQGYFLHKDKNETVIFDAFFRNNPMDSGYSIMAGLEQVMKNGADTAARAAYRTLNKVKKKLGFVV